MARFSKDGEIRYEIVDDFNFVVDEKNNSFIALRKLRWGDSENVKLDLRRWISTPEGEQCGKGVSFLTENGPHELVHTLIEQGFGDTGKILNLTSRRDDFGSVMQSLLNGTLTNEQIELLSKEPDETFDESEGFYDPREEDIFGEDFDDEDDEEEAL